MTQNERMTLPIWKKLIFIIVTLIIFAVQVVIFIFVFQMNLSDQVNTTLFFIIEIFAFVIVLHIIHKPINPNYKLTWSILILLLPLPFSFLYYLNHRSRKLPRRKQKRIDSILKQHRVQDVLIPNVGKKHPIAAKHATILNKTAGVPLYQNTKYTFLSDGYLKHQDFMKELALAKEYIFIECFILGEGVLLDELLPLLIEKGRAGVEIKIIYDDLGSRAILKKATIKKITQIPNCQIANYNPLGLNINPAFNYRDHRKIIVIDGKIAYCGGDNLADEYIHKKERFGFWRDNCGKYEGEAVATFISLFVQTWYMSTKQILAVHKYVRQTNIVNTTSYVMPFGDGPSNFADPGYDLFKSLIVGANQKLYISTPYFIIDDSMIESIVLAIKSGVDVRILMPGIPDKKTAYYLAHFHYRNILNAGGKIYEYTPGFNHAKNIIVDTKYAFIGTINMDYRSLFLHYECGALILLDEEIKKMETDFLEACDQSKLVTYQDWKTRPWWERIISYMLYLISPMF